jgi:gliding motility-associated-like protein
LKKSTLTILFFLLAFILRAQVPSANFTAAIVSGCSPLIVDFQDLSTGSPSSWAWDFGNGATSSLKNPSTTYFNPGVYTVRLTVTNVNGSNTLVRTSYITIFDKPSVKFKVNDSSGCFPFPAQFTDTSTAGPGTTNTAWFWDFGDGSQSTQQNPLHIYTNTGNYSVTLKVTNDKGCWRVFSKPNYIQIIDGVQSNFSNTQPTVCQPPFNISFNNLSTGTGLSTFTYWWDFGDGNTSTDPNPQHTYLTPGSYTVTLATISSLGCTDTMRKVNHLTFLNINSAINAPDSICFNQVATVQNATTPPPVSSAWDFGDGTVSNNTNPQKFWTTPGNYTIQLINTYSYCQDTATKNIKVLPRPVSNFQAADIIKCAPPLTVQFQNQSQAAVSWLWNFGDGNTSTQANPSHIYTSYGSFTVQLITTNSSGCTDTLVRNNYVNIMKPVITMPGLPQQGCVPYTAQFTGVVNTLDQVTSFFWDFGDGNTSALQNPSHVYPLQGTYNVTLTITTSTGCTETLTIPSAVKVGRRPVIDFVAMPNPVCAFQNVQFMDQTNEADGWTWHFGDGVTSTSQNPIHQYTDTGWFNVTLIAMNNGCMDSLKKLNFIKIKPPIARFNFIPDCNNRFLFYFKDTSISATSWLWNFGDGNTSTLQNPSHVYNGYGTYNVTLTVTNDTCSHSITKPIKVFDEDPDFVANQTVACRTGIINFSVTNTNFANIVSYAWNFGNGVTVTTANPSITANYPLSGTYTVTLTTTDIYGCTDVRTKTNYIRINGPTASFTAQNTSGCKGLTTTFTDLSTADGTNNIVNWRWDFGDGTIQNFSAPPFQHVYNTPGNFSVKLIVTDAIGCRDSVIAFNIINTTDPKANFNSVDTLACPGSNVYFQNLSTAYNYTSSWDFGDGNISTQQHPVHAYANTGLYTVKLSITDFFGCSDSIIRNEYIKVSRPIAGFTISDSISSCIPFQVDFTNTSQYYSSALWNLGNGMSSMASPTSYYVIPGTYTVGITVTSPGGCMDSAFRTITLYDTIGTRIEYAPLSGCSPLTVYLEAFSPGPVRLTWDLGDGVIETSDSLNLTHEYNTFGNYIPKVILTDPSGCIIPVTGEDTIRIIGAEAKFGVDNGFFCDSGMVNFLDSTTFNNTITSYTWDFGDGNTSNLQQPSHFYAFPGLYTVSLSVQTQDLCVDTFTLTHVVKVVESPLVSIGGDTVICVNDLLTHLGVFERPDTSLVSWSWQFPNGNTSILQNPNRQFYSVPGNFIVTTVATNSSGCKDTTTRNILVNPLPIVTMPSIINKQAGTPVLIPATYTSNVVSYTWAPVTNLSCTDCAQPYADPKFNTKYNVAFVDSNGCRNVGQTEVIVFCINANVFIPNTFSPNGDGSNDIFYVRGKGLERVKTLRIFNRWGEVVFEQTNFPVNNAAHGWNGRYKGNKPVSDVYVYQVEVFCENSEIIRFEGNVALIQ